MKLVLFLFHFFFYVSAFADTQSKNCSDDKKVCLEISANTEFSKKEIMSVQSKIVLKTDMEFHLLKFDLWMVMPNMPEGGHTSAPLSWVLKENNPIVYQVNELDFFMVGQWQFRMHYSLDQEHKLLVIPIEVKE